MAENKENNETDGTTGATSSTEANTGTTKDKKKAKTIKVKGFPFSQEEAVKKQAEASKSPRQLTVAPGITLDMVWIPAGTFAMGDNNDPSASPAFKTQVKEGFWMSTTEITNEQFGALFPEHDSRYIGQTWKDHTTPGYAANLPKQPVIRVSWEEANDFCKNWERKINAVSPFRQRHNGNGPPVQDRPVTSGSVTVKQTSASTKTWQIVRLSTWPSPV